jgi:dynein heavy chain
MASNKTIVNEELFYKLWINESFRVFYDRLTNEDDRNWYKDLVMELLSKNFKVSPERDEIFVHKKIMFGDLLKLDSPI